MKYYTGIGSRKAPIEILEFMNKIAKWLYNRDYILRSGGAEGSDSAFESGAFEKKQIFLPWPGFNESLVEFIEIPQKAYEIASQVHPVWETLKPYVRDLHARNAMQVLGQNLDDPSDFLICWTKNGSTIGGTATAIRIAQENDVPIINLWHEKDRNRILRNMNI